MMGVEPQLVCVPPGDVKKLWGGAVRGMIDAGFAAFDCPLPDDILDQFENGTRLLWLAVDAEATIIAAMTTQLFEMRSGRVCKMLECGGERMSTWLHLRAGIEEYAKREGCGRVIVEGRGAWSRLLSDYRMIGVTLEKRI